MPSTGTISVVGLGPGDPSALTQAAEAALRSGRVWLRTRVHPTLAELPGSAAWPSFDELYERAQGFDQLYDEIVERLIEAARSGPLVYAVPGHPLFGESTVTRLLSTARDHGIDVRVLPAVSFLDAATSLLEIDPLDSQLQIVDALELAAVSEQEPFAGGRLPLSSLRPAIVAQLYAPSVASAAKLALLRRYPAEHPVRLIYSAGSEREQVVDARLYELDHATADHLTSVYLPPVDPLQTGRESDALQRIVARLRAPGGCPWDREQTHRSLTQSTIEEAYEVVDAIERDDAADLQEELGDLLLQVYLHAQLAEEAGTFTLEDVFDAISSKLVRRHPHVFGTAEANTADAVVRRWDEIKRAERADKGGSAVSSPLGNVPVGLPALARAQTILRRARRAPETADHPALEPVESTTSQLGALLSSTDDKVLGLLLAGVALLAECAGLDAEAALRGWTRDIERTMLGVGPVGTARDETRSATARTTVEPRPE